MSYLFKRDIVTSYLHTKSHLGQDDERVVVGFGGLEGLSQRAAHPAVVGLRDVDHENGLAVGHFQQPRPEPASFVCYFLFNHH